MAEMQTKYEIKHQSIDLMATNQVLLEWVSLTILDCYRDINNKNNHTFYNVITTKPF
jgi:hypothetical protein